MEESDWIEELGGTVDGSLEKVGWHKQCGERNEGHTPHLLQAVCHMLNYCDLYADISYKSISL